MSTAINGGKVETNGRGSLTLNIFAFSSTQAIFHFNPLYERRKVVPNFLAVRHQNICHLSLVLGSIGRFQLFRDLAVMQGRLIDGVDQPGCCAPVWPLELVSLACGMADNFLRKMDLISQGSSMRPTT